VSTTPNSPSGTPLPPLFTKREAYALTILSIAFIIASTVVHFAVGAWAESVVPHFKQEATPPPQRVTVQTLIKPPPKPTPTPRPTPTPTPPPPLKNTPPPVSLKLHVVQTKSDTSGTGPAEQAYTPPPTGSENGIPSAVPTVAPATAAPTAPPAPVGPTQITDSEFIHQLQPDYPELAKQENIQGDVTVRVTIGPAGQVMAAIISSSSGNPLLDQAALKAARDSSYKAPMVNGVPAQRDYLIIYTFRLDQ
jgi:TonB family protein